MASTSGKLACKTDAAFALTTLARLTNELNALLSERDKAVLEAQGVRARDIFVKTAEIQLLQQRLEEWAVANRAKEFQEAKSLELPRGTVGFRLGQRSLAPLKSWTWPKVLAGLKGRWLKYRRMKPEVDKRALLADSLADPKGKVKLSAAQLKALGVAVIQEEAFFVELRSETPALSAKG